MQVIMYQANAFTDKLFEGSPIGIVPDARDLTEENMKRIVQITNLEKIAFITAGENDCYNLRFFNSQEEMVFCDCATVASFYALAERGYIKGVENGNIRVYECTEIGKKPIDIYFKDWEVDRVELCEQKPVVICNDLNLDKLSSLLKIDSSEIGISGFDIKPEITQKSLKDLIIPVKSNEALDKISINIDSMKSNPILKDIDNLYLFSIDQMDIINYVSFRLSTKETCASEETTSDLI